MRRKINKTRIWNSNSFKIREEKNFWIGVDNNGRNLFIDSNGMFQVKFIDKNGQKNYLFPILKDVKNYYWVSTIMPINKLKSMLGKLAKNDSAKMRKRFYRHVRDAYRENRLNENDLF